MEYKFEVIETRTVLCEYLVDADSIEEAEMLALAGNTTDEDIIRNIAVIDRVIVYE
jgi:hypothetical protein